MNRALDISNPIERPVGNKTLGRIEKLPAIFCQGSTFFHLHITYVVIKIYLHLISHSSSKCLDLYEVLWENSAACKKKYYINLDLYAKNKKILLM